MEHFGELPTRGENPEQDWNAGYFYGVHEQKQKGKSYFGLSIPVGRLSSDELFELARISKRYGNGEVRTCNSQNIVIPNIPNEQVDVMLEEDIFKKFTIEPRNFIGYSVSCTGIEYCNLALVETKERMRRIATYLDEQVALDSPVRIHMIGCPNSCGQRQIADIGLQGVLMKSDKGMIEAFEIYVGGTLGQEARFNEKLKGRVSADALGPVLKELLHYFKEHKAEKERFFHFVQRVGVNSLQDEFNQIKEKIS